MANQQIKGIKVNNVPYELNLGDIVSHFTSPNGTDYILKVDNNGKLYTEAVGGGNTPSTDAVPAAGYLPEGTSTGSLITFNGGSKLYINEVYCGGEDANENSMGYASHNFVELANLTFEDLDLEGLSLQYAEDGKGWRVLPLHGVIKQGSTFLIRGAQCSNPNSPTTKIHVDKFDMEWYVDGTNLIKFSTDSAKFYLMIGTAQYGSVNPYGNNQVNTDAIGYIDLVGISGTKSADGFEKSAYSANGGLKNSRLFKKYYAMDPVKQATKAIDKRSNANDWNYVDLTKEDGEVIPSIEVFTPRASSENKNIYYNKTTLSTEKPSMITCSFGIQATDGGNGATRCFNWLSGKMSDKFIWIKSKDSSDWGAAHESFREGDGRTAWYHDFYNQIVKEYSNKTYIIVNKFIMSGISAGEYEYVAGAKKSDGTPDLAHCTDVRSFVVKSSADCESFRFVQTSDQQGFNWDEYRVWNAASKVIMKESGSTLDFMINTGDMTQNGNRLGEWLDYFDAKCPEMNNIVEMATIGNNDLSLNDLSKIARGEDYEKIWHENMNFFYTFEYDESNLPVFEVNGTSYFIPSLYSFNYGKTHFICMNTEIKALSETSTDGYGFAESGNFYPQIKTWCEADVEANKEGKDWILAYCHEMPFTILTPEATHNLSTKRKTTRTGGCNANENVPESLKYWFSEFCQTNNIPLVLGGHKHTQATSYPLIENISYNENERTVKSMQPIIVVNAETLAEFNGATSLVHAEGTIDGVNGKTYSYSGDYPNTWFENDVLMDIHKNEATLGTFMMESNVSSITRPDGKVTKPVVYAMSQSTGYKHTSNKELPAPNLPWLRYYFPCTVEGGANPSQSQLNGPTANKYQKFPFYTVWDITPNTITGNVRKVYGVFNDSGKFDINIDGQYVKNGYCATNAGTTDSVGGHSDKMFSINGIKSMQNIPASTNKDVITITK